MVPYLIHFLNVKTNNSQNKKNKYKAAQVIADSTPKVQLEDNTVARI
jgi:hypothetical protein